jgi:hypothetical protein
MIRRHDNGFQSAATRSGLIHLMEKCASSRAKTMATADNASRKPTSRETTWAV